MPLGEKGPMFSLAHRAGSVFSRDHHILYQVPTTNTGLPLRHHTISNPLSHARTGHCWSKEMCAIFHQDNPGYVTCMHPQMLFISIMHSHSFLQWHSSGILWSLHTVHPFGLVLLTWDLGISTNALPFSVPKPLQHNLVCSISQLSNNLTSLHTSSFLTWFIQSKHTSQIPQLHYLQSHFLCFFNIPSLSPIQCSQYHYSLVRPSHGIHSKWSTTLPSFLHTPFLLHSF